MPDLAPIILFVYNRPWHTRQCLESLMKNELAAQSTLYIYADGPKENASEEQLNKIYEVRSILREKKWCKEVCLVESENNRGLTSSISEGITSVLNKHSHAIVLEDDIVVSEGFLPFMNKALRMYENDENVFGVSGYAHRTDEKDISDTYFLRMTSSWGWGTWQRAWKNYNSNVKELINGLKKKSNFNTFNVGGYNFFNLLLSQDKTVHDTWDIQWYASIFLADGLFLFPKKSLSKNIGFDNSGVHCNDETFFKTELTDHIELEKQKVEESWIARKAIERSFSKEFNKKNETLKIVKRKIAQIKTSIFSR